MQILSNATKRYLQPIDISKLRVSRECTIHKQPIMRLSLPSKDEEIAEEGGEVSAVKSFIVEVFDKLDDETEVSPYSTTAAQFVSSRFKHGCIRRSKSNCYHERYEVPATDYSLYLYLYSWTGAKEKTEAADHLLNEMIAHERLYEKCAVRSATYKEKLHELLPAFKAQHKAYKEQQLLEGEYEEANNRSEVHFVKAKLHFNEALNTPKGVEHYKEFCEAKQNYEYHRRYFLEFQKVANALALKRSSQKRVVPPLAPDDAMLLDIAFIKSLNLSPFLANRGTFNPNAPSLTVYQAVCATNCIAVPGYAYYLEPGCGKTAPAIATIDYTAAHTFVAAQRPARILVLGPKNIRGNWVKEINRFSRMQLKTTILQGANEYDRQIKLLCALVGVERGHVVIAGYETAANTDVLQGIEWDLVILDESHSIANMGTKRAKFCLKLRDSAAKRLILTGTPVRNTPFDLYAQFEFLGKGYSGFSSFNAFKNFYGVWKNVPGKGFRVLEELQNIPMLQERLAKYTFLMTKEEAMPALPEKTFDTLECTLSPEQARVYKQIAAYLQAEISNATSGVHDQLTIRSHLTKLLRLAEITSGYSATDESGIYRFNPNPKLEMLVEEIKNHIDEYPNSKIQIWCHYHVNIIDWKDRLEKEGIKAVEFYGETPDKYRAIAEEKFNCDPETKVFVGSPAAGGQGLNLLGFDPANPNDYQTNCDWVIYYSQNWSSTARTQSSDRAYRKGTRVPVRITDAIVPNSIDGVILDRVMGKIEMASNLQDIKTILSAALNPDVNGD